MLELVEYKAIPRKGLKCERLNKEILLEQARTPQIKAKCENLLKSKGINYGFINPTVEPRISKECTGLFEYDIVCKYINKNGRYIEKFDQDEPIKCNKLIWCVILAIILYCIFNSIK